MYFFAVKINISINNRIQLKAQAGWLQHDFGHLSVFKSTKLDHLWHNIVISTIKVFF